MHVYACYVSAVSYPGLIPSVALHGVLHWLLCYNLTLFFFYSRTGCNRFGNAMRGIFGAVAFLAVTGNVSYHPCAITRLDCCRQQSKGPGKVVAGLPSLVITAEPGSVSVSKHSGYMRVGCYGMIYACGNFAVWDVFV